MPRPTWGWPSGIPEGSDFRLEAVLTRNGAPDTTTISTAGTYTLSVQDSALNAGVALLTDEGSDSLSQLGSGLLAAWEITDTQSSGWAAGTYPGDIKLVDSGGTISYWPVTMVVRSAVD